MTGKVNVVGAGDALDAVTGRATVTTQTTYLALLTAAPTVSSTPATMTEYTGTGYTRPTMAMSAPSGTPRVTSNTAALTIGPITAGAGATVSHWAEVSSASGTTGTMRAQGDWATGRTPAVGDSLTVAIGAVTVQID